MKTLATLVLIAAVAILATHVVTAGSSYDRPAAVAETNWISLSDRFGFVIDEASPAGNALLPAELMPPAKGHFVVKTAAGWRRLAVTAPPDLSKL